MPFVGAVGDALRKARSRGWGRWIALAVGVVLLLVVVAPLAYGLFSGRGDASGAILLRRSAPDFTLNLFRGGTFALSEARGSPVVVNFWSSWCSSCREEAPYLEQAWRQYRDRGVVFVGVNIWDEREDALRFLDEFNITYPNGPDEASIFVAYGATGVPETFFINADGMIVYRYVGPLSPQRLSDLVGDILK